MARAAGDYACDASSRSDEMKYGIMAIIGVVLLTVTLAAISYLLPSGGDTTSNGNSALCRKIEFQGHTYITWKFMNAGGMVHDPDCKCQRAK